jgi:hypothetical protein
VATHGSSSPPMSSSSGSGSGGCVTGAKGC